MENKTPYHIKAWFIILASSIIALAILVTALRTEGMAPEDSDKVIELIRKAQLTEKQVVVAEIKHEVLKWPKYTIRVGLQWSRKPIPAIKGLTTEERAKEWLISQGSTNVKTSLPIWQKFWQEYKIDYTVPLCISWADSSLGKALKSKNNLSNYWNNDRWDVKHFDSVEEWIRITFWALSHGKYMSWHETIATLSGEWRIREWLPWCSEEKDYRKKCWATSTQAWSSNVLNCMSAIKDKQVKEDYNFRL